MSFNLVPGPPAKVKVLSTGDSTFYVSWLSPSQPAGIIKRYTTVYPSLVKFLSKFCFIQMDNNSWTYGSIYFKSLILIWRHIESIENPALSKLIYEIFFSFTQ